MDSSALSACSDLPEQLICSLRFEICEHCGDPHSFMDHRFDPRTCLGSVERIFVLTSTHHASVGSQRDETYQ